jgi:hypothetical protein
VHQHWQLPGQAAAVQVERTHAAATRGCAYAGCANLSAGDGRSKLCSGCRVARYCGAECSHADWRQGGHRRACKALAAGPAAAAGGGSGVLGGTMRTSLLFCPVLAPSHEHC